MQFPTLEMTVRQSRFFASLSALASNILHDEWMKEPGFQELWQRMENTSGSDLDEVLVEMQSLLEELYY